MALRPASKKRRLLAIYLDWCVFAAPWGLTQWAVGRMLGRPWDDRLAAGLTFFVMEAVLWKVSATSPGDWLLRIVQDPAGGEWVAEEQLEHENLLGMFLGTFGMLGGAKTMTGWVVGVPRLTPVFGLGLPWSLEVVAQIVVGLFCWALGAALLRLHRSAVALGAVYVTTYALALYAWSDKLPGFLREAVAAKRAWQGRPPPDPATFDAALPFALAAINVSLGLFLLAIGISVVWTRRARQLTG